MDHRTRMAARRGDPPVHPGTPGAGRTGVAARALWAAVSALLLLLAALLPPERPLPFDICLWHRLTGFDCLGCGLTRSVCSLMHGDIAASLALHPAGPVVAAIIALLAVRGVRDAVDLTRRG